MVNVTVSRAELFGPDAGDRHLVDGFPRRCPLDCRRLLLQEEPGNGVDSLAEFAC
jgi:hypothetical protein